MRKPFRRVIPMGVCLAAFVFAVSVAPLAKAAPSPVKVGFVVAPEEVFCFQSNKDTFLEISYGWDHASDLAPLENLLPIGSKAAPRSSLPGTLTTTSRIGIVSKPSVNVDYGPGHTRMMYVPNKTDGVALREFGQTLVLMLVGFLASLLYSYVPPGELTVLRGFPFGISFEGWQRLTILMNLLFWYNIAFLLISVRAIVFIQSYSRE